MVQHDEALEAFIEDAYSPEQQLCINRALSVFITFSYGAAFEDLAQSVQYVGLQETQILQLEITELIRKHLFSLCRMHAVTVDWEASISQLSQVMTGLYRLTKVEDPSPLLSIVENTEMTNEEKLATLLSQTSEMSKVEYMDILLQVRPKIIENIQTLLEERERLIQDRQVQSPEMERKLGRLAERIKSFFKLRGDGSIGFEFIALGMEVGHPFGLYIPIAEPEIPAATAEKTAENILSVLLMGVDTFESPVEAFRQHSESIIHDSSSIPRVEQWVINYYRELTGYESASKHQRDTIVRTGD